MENSANAANQLKAWSDTLIQSLVEGIITIDSAGNITSFNQGAEALTGWSEENAISSSINQVFLTPAGDTPFLLQLPAPGCRRTLRVITQNDVELNLSVSIVRMSLPGQCSEQMVLVLRDVTEEEASRSLHSYFLANISHEFRTPLSALNASVELLLDQLPDLSMDEIAELLGSVHYSLTGLQALIDNLLESASIEARRFHIRRRPADIHQVAAESVRVMAPLLKRRGQQLIQYIPVSLPTVEIDPVRLTQVLFNLLSNASKFSPLGDSIELRIEALPESLLRISVADSGPGIPVNERDQIFRRFIRLGKGESWYGVGLGLSVVKTIIEEHGGQVGVSDRPTGGSIFWFTLPINGDIQ